MIVHTAIRVTTTFQRMALEFLDSPGSIFTVNGAGTEITVTNAEIPSLKMVLSGTGLSSNGSGTFNGSITGFDFVDTSTGLSMSTLLPVIILMQSMFDTAQAGIGDYSPINYLTFYNLIMPLWSFLVFTGSRFADVIEGFATNDTMSGKRGNDTLIISDGDDTFNGGKGAHDSVDGREMTSSMTANLAQHEVNHAGGLTMVYSVEDVDGTEFDDTITGNNKDNTLKGFAGNDTIKGKGGDDKITGGTGNDWLFGGAGNDTLSGGAGDDELQGGSGADDLSGGDGKDELLGGAGRDTLFGGRNADHLWGGSGNDELDGEQGNDVITGGKGNDKMTGGRGSDTFVFLDDGFNESDRITDFSATRDTLKLQGVSASDVTVSTSGSDTIVTFDDTSGGSHQITLEGINVTESDIDFLFY